MKIPSPIPGPECSECLRGLRDQALAACEAGRETETALRAKAGEMIDLGLNRDKVPAHIATGFLGLIMRETGRADPFRDQKAADFAASRKAVAAMGDIPDTLAARARAAILGNALDHFTGPESRERWQKGWDLELGLDHLPRAQPLLRPGAEVVILADNAGEQCFDRLLVEHLQGRGCRVSYVAKSGPVQNDLTLADLAAQGECHGLGRVLASGTAQVGLNPMQIPRPLRSLLAGADLVIAKGMGHYESLRRAAFRTDGKPSPWPMLFLLLAKCGPVARSLGVEPGEGAALLTG